MPNGDCAFHALYWHQALSHVLAALQRMTTGRWFHLGELFRVTSSRRTGSRDSEPPLASVVRWQVR